MKSKLPLLTLWLGVSACGFASTLVISVGEQFSSSVTPTPLASPSGSWTMSFDVNSTPAATNTDPFGFDAPFANFSYHLNGVPVAMSPESIRFATDANLGLFTVYFGPESGYDSNGNAIPEFSFLGSQVFSGSTTTPAIVPGNYAVDSWTYSDNLNYDNHPSALGTVSIILATIPEPSTGGLFTLLVFGCLIVVVRAKISKAAL